MIHTPDRRVRVFVSSTLGELAAERAVVQAAIERLRLIPVMFELGARPHAPRALYRAYLDQSDVFIGIYWQRYGWIAPGEDVSGLEDEYRLAAGRLPQLVYLKEPAPDRDDQLSDLLRRIQSDDRLAYRRFSTADELAELVTDDLAVLLSERFRPEAPEPDADRARATGPPAPLDPTIGRGDDVAAITALVRGGHRLVTLTGPGGIGKSRLAVDASRALAEYDGATVFVALDAVADAGLVVAAIAERLGVRLGGVGHLLEEVVAELSRRPTLLLVDNFEHVAAASSDLAAILERCVDTVALVTSRHALRLHGEREYVVPVLSGPAAIELFAARAAAVRPGFALTDDGGRAVEAICEHLDRLPLAIELAAACMRLFTPEALLEQLSKRFDVLTRGAADAPERQRTLRATMDWSYELLDGPQRRLFAQLAVFSGGWTIAAVEPVCGIDGGQRVLDELAGLVEKSLVTVDDGSSEPRLRMLETIRSYAAERLEALPERAETERRHTQWLFELLLGSGRTIRPAHHRAWLERFDAERANLRAAVTRALRDRDARTALDLVRATLGYLSLRDAEAEAASWLLEAFDVADAGDAPLRSRLLWTRAVLAGALGRYTEAEELGAAARAEHADLADGFDVAIAAMAQAVTASGLRAADEALALALRAAEAMAAISSDVGEAYMWQTAGTLALLVEPDHAHEYLSRGLRIAELMENDGLRAQASTLLGYCARRTGRRDDAIDLFVTAAEAGRRSGQRSSMAYALDGLAAAAVELGQPKAAARALASSEAIRSSIHRTAWAAFDPLLHEVRSATRAALGDDAYEAERAAGAGSDVSHALDDALEVVFAHLPR